MKILIVQNIEGIAGSEKYFLALIPELEKIGVHCELFCVHKTSTKDKAQNFYNLLSERDIPYVTKEVSSYGLISIPRAISKHYKKNKFDLMHTHLIYADFWGALVRKFFNKKAVVVSVKHGYHEETYVKYCNQPENLPKNLYYKICKFAHKYANASYACSYGLRDFHVLSGLVKEGEVDVIQHGFDYPEVDSSQVENKVLNEIQLLIVGRLVKRKGHKFVLDILSDIISKHSNIKLQILGSGEEEQNLKNLVKKLNLGSHVQFLGFKYDVENYIAASDIVLVPSYSEGLPLVIFEAFNAKKPVVSFDSIGCNEMVIHNETGLITKPFDVNHLKENIIKLIEDKELRVELGENGYKLLKSHFTPKRMAQETKDFLEQTLK